MIALSSFLNTRFGQSRKQKHSKDGFIIGKITRRNSNSQTQQQTKACAVQAEDISQAMVFPEQEDEAYPYISRRRRTAKDEQIVSSREKAFPYRHELELLPEGKVEYCVKKTIQLQTQTQTQTTNKSKQEFEAFVYKSLREGILGIDNFTEKTSSREATGKEIRENVFGSNEEDFAKRRAEGPFYRTIGLGNNHQRKFYVCETQSQSAFGSSSMKTFVVEDSEKRFIKTKMIDSKSSRVFEFYEGSNAIEIDPSSNSIVLVARGRCKLKGLLKKFAQRQVANVLLAKVRANLENTCAVVAASSNDSTSSSPASQPPLASLVSHSHGPTALA